MKRWVILEVITPHTGMIDSVPGGFVYVDQMLSEAGLADRMSSREDDEARWLRRCLAHLDRRFQRWLQVRLIQPMSLPGFFRVIRFRIRSYPTFILGRETYAGRSLEELETFVRRQAGFMAKDEESTLDD